jgi:hypothetical protein
MNAAAFRLLIERSILDGGVRASIFFSGIRLSVVILRRCANMPFLRFIFWESRPGCSVSQMQPSFTNAHADAVFRISNNLGVGWEFVHLGWVTLTTGFLCRLALSMGLFFTPSFI